MLCVAALVTNLGAAGCYRSVSFHPHEVREAKLRPDGSAFRVVYESGKAVDIDSYDSIAVERKNEKGHLRWFEQEVEFETPIETEFGRDALRLRNASVDRTFPLTEIERVTVYQRAPDRGVIVAVAGLGGFFVCGMTRVSFFEGERGYREAPNPTSAFLSATLCGAVGVAITIPLTAPFGKRGSAPTPSAPGAGVTRAAARR